MWVIKCLAVLWDGLLSPLWDSYDFMKKYCRQSINTGEGKSGINTGEGESSTDIERENSTDIEGESSTDKEGESSTDIWEEEISIEIEGK